MRISLPGRTVMWLGHYCVLLLPAAVALSVADDATGSVVTAVTWAATAAWTAWIAAWALTSRRHEEHLCERCIAASPLDPQAKVDRWHPVLRAFHARTATAAVFAVSIGWNFASVILFPRAHQQPGWALALDALAVIVVGTSYLVTWQHRRLYPWCPYCRWGKGGQHEVSPDVPAPVMSR